MAHARTKCERKWTMFNGSKWWSRLWLGLIEKPLRFLFSVSLQRTGTVLRATWSSKCLRDSKLGFAFLGQEKYLDKIAVLLSYFIIGARCFCLRRWHFGGCNVDSHSHKPWWENPADWAQPFESAIVQFRPAAVDVRWAAAHLAPSLVVDELLNECNVW